MPKTEVPCLVITGLLAIAGLAITAPMFPAPTALAQQVSDTTWVPPGHAPHWSMEKGPHVVIDAAHHNFHTVDGRYRPFADLLRRDGCRVDGSALPFSGDGLCGVDILVVANALHARNEGDWTLPTPPAFDAAEVEAVREWVRGGGALLLIADHMPFPGAASSLAAGFGFSFRNGFAGAGHQISEISFHPRSVGSGIYGGALAPHAIVTGGAPGEGIDSLVSFSGSAFRPPADAEPLLVLPSDTISLEPVEAWQFGKDTPRIEVGGWSQGATLRYGKGRVAVFGEAAMFSAQLGGTPPHPMGMNSPSAPQNFRFLLNTIHWLAGELEGVRSPGSSTPAGSPRQGSGR